MIHWNKTKEILPAVDMDDKFNIIHKISKKVLVNYKSKGSQLSGVTLYGFARYYHELEDWVIVDFKGDCTIEYWSEINDPNDQDSTLSHYFHNGDLDDTSDHMPPL